MGTSHAHLKSAKNRIRYPHPKPDFPTIHQELTRPGVTLQLLWEEYQADHQGGYRYSRFCVSGPRSTYSPIHLFRLEQAMDMIMCVLCSVTPIRRGTMQVSSNGNVRRTKAEWRKIVSRYERSELAARDFCLKEDLKLSSFGTWHRKLSASSNTEAFVKVTPESQTSTSWELEVSLPNGCMLRFQG